VRCYRPWADPEDGASADYADAERLLTVISNDIARPQELIHRARERASALVAEHERPVRDIAGELFRHGELTGRDAHRIFRDTIISAPPGKIADRERSALRPRRSAQWRCY